MSVTAVLDVGKSNVKLHGIDAAGQVVWSDMVANRILPGPPFAHHDLVGLEAWVIDRLGRLNKAHPVGAIIPAAHGGSGVLVDDDGPVLPMMDYEQALPAEIAKAYLQEAGPWRDRGSFIMLGAAHAARQLLWMERAWPADLGRARAYLNTPQYWSWRLSGVMADEVTSAAAQSHLWSVLDRRSTVVAVRHGWTRLLPPMRPAWQALGPIRPQIARAAGLDPAVAVHCGIHDSSANFYLYQAAGLSGFTLISTGTWIVGMTDRTAGDPPDEPGSTINADVNGNAVPGKLCMGGREFAAVAGDAKGPASFGVLADLVRRGTMPLPVFGQDDGLFPGLARRGRIVGPPPANDAERYTLGVLYVALLTVATVVALPETASVVLDGSFVRDPLYAAAVAALLPRRTVGVNTSQTGIASGAAALVRHGTKAGAALTIEPPSDRPVPDLASYLAAWRHETHLELERLK